MLHTWHSLCPTTPPMQPHIIVMIGYPNKQSPTRGRSAESGVSPGPLCLPNAAQLLPHCAHQTHRRAQRCLRPAEILWSPCHMEESFASLGVVGWIGHGSGVITRHGHCVLGMHAVSHPLPQAKSSREPPQASQCFSNTELPHLMS